MKLSIKLALLATVAATSFTAWKDMQLAVEPVVAVADRASSQRLASVSGDSDSATRELVGARIDAAATKPTDLFTGKVWLRESPKPQKSGPTKAVAPVAPGLPFEYSGVWVEGIIRYVVLVAGGQQFLLCSQCNTPGALRAGDVLLEKYRFESLDASQVVFTFLPLNQRQSLMLETLQ